MNWADLTALDQYADTPFPPDYPPNDRTFFPPVDEVHQVLMTCLQATTSSLQVCMYSLTDPDVAGILKALCQRENVAVQITLDHSQADSEAEAKLLSQESYPSTVIAIGDSEKGQIIHDKVAVIDGILVVSGSVNWSPSGEGTEDNEMRVTLDRAVAYRYSQRLQAIHSWVLAHPVS